MKKTVALFSVTAVSALTLSGVLANPSSAAQMTHHMDKHSHQMMHHSMKTEVKQVMVKSQTEIKLSGKNKDLMNKMIMVKGEDGTKLWAKYNSKKMTFALPKGKMLMPGVTYKISASWAHIPMKESQIAIANLIKAKQIGPNRIELNYDRPVDMKSATMSGNYWIMSNQDKAMGIANLGKNDMVTPTNGLKADRVSIKPVKHSMTKFIMTFKESAKAGVSYKVIPCNISVNGEMGYMGANFNKMTMSMFSGKDFSMK